MPKTLTYEEVDTAFKHRGYKLLATEYVNSKTKLPYKCPNGHVGEITYNDFSRNRGCPQCWEVRKRDQRLTPISELQKSFADDGYDLLTKKYVAGDQELESVCSRGHPYLTNVRKWNSGYRCSKCAAIENSGEHNPNWNPDRQAVEGNKKVWTAWRNLLRAGIHNKHRLSSDRIRAILGYDWSELRRHVESHENWDECKDGAWHVDHVFPIKAFTDACIYDPKVINALDNLRPLSAAENFRKNKFYDREAFESYLRSKGIQWQNPVMVPKTSKF